jgi:hypothetical protein
MSFNNSCIAEFPDELTIDSSTLTGGYDVIGSLDQPPVMMIFDNQSTVDIGISKNGTSTWRTFPAGEALVLDMRAAKGNAENFTASKGTTFYATGAAGTGNFSISYLYAAF